MIFLYMFIGYILFLGLLLIIPSVFSRKLTAILVTFGFILSLIAYSAFSTLTWWGAVLTMLVVALLAAYLVANRMPTALLDEPAEEDAISEEAVALEDDTQPETAVQEEIPPVVEEEELHTEDPAIVSEEVDKNQPEAPEQVEVAQVEQDIAEDDYYQPVERKPLEAEEPEEQEEEEALPSRVADKASGDKSDDSVMSRRKKLFEKMEKRD